MNELQKKTSMMSLLSRFDTIPKRDVSIAMHEVTVGRHYVSNYFYCCIRTEGLLHDDERDLVAIAKFCVTLNIFVSRFRLICLWLLDNTNLRYGLLLLAYVKFADRTLCRAAKVVIPSVRTTTPETHARLALNRIIRLACIPVGVCHSRHRSVRVRRSPDE